MMYLYLWLGSIEKDKESPQKQLFFFILVYRDTKTFSPLPA